MKPLLFTIVILSGCQYPDVREPAPLLEVEVIRMSKEGVPADAIIERIRESHTIYLMDAEDVIKLKEQGVDLKVINYMLDTRRRDLERRAYHPYYHDPYWCPPPPPIGFGFGLGYWW
jgi:hypothetical protein